MTDDVLCACCEQPAPIIFKPTNRRETWLVLSCDECLEPVCRQCSDTDEGIVTCTLCLQQANLAKAEGH